MDNLNKLGLLCLVMALFVAGCGKKGEKKHTQMAQSDSIPLVAKDETVNLLEDSDISDFAFVDDETVNADKSTTVAKAGDMEEGVAAQEEATSFDFKTVHFDFNKNGIREDQRTVVAQDTEVAKQAVEQGKNVVVEGHCCQIGSASYNLALSQRRAESVKTAMIKEGVPANNIKTVGYGYERPVVWSDQTDRTKLIRELSPNRRAEVLVN